MQHNDVESSDIVESPQSGNGKPSHPDLASLRSLIEMLPQIAFVGSGDGSLVYFNQYLHDYTGIERNAQGVEAWTPFIHPDDLARALSAWHQATQTGREHSGEYRIRRASDGQYRWHQVHSVPVKDASGVVTIWMSTMLDVHQQKVTEEELRASEARLRASEAKFRALIENSSSVILLFDAAGNVINTSLPRNPILGYTADEARTLQIRDICHPDDRKALRAASIECMASPGVPIPIVVRLKSKSGAWRNLDFSLTNWLNNPDIGAIVGNYSDITDRRQAEEALRTREAKFRALIENSADAIVLLDRDLRIQYSTPATACILGYQSGSFIGTPLLDFCHPNDHEALAEMLAICLAQPGVSVPGAVRIRHRNGTWRYLEGTLTNLLDDPDVRAIVNNYRDITEKMEQQEALRLSEDKFKRLFENGPDAITLSRLEDGVFLEVNGAFEALCGYDRKEIIGRTSKELEIREKPELREQMVAALKENGRVSVQEFRLRRKGGQLVPVQFSADVIDVHGTPCLLTVSRDISDRYQAEEALRSSENKFKSAFENSPDAITISSLEDGRFLEVNEAFERLSGYKIAEAKGRSGVELGIWLSQEQRAKVARALRETGRLTGQELVFRRKDGQLRSTQFSAELIKIHGTMCMLTVARDVTDRKQAEEALRASEERFKKAFGSSPDALTITTLAEGRYLEINEAFERLSGWSREEAIGNTAAKCGIWAHTGDRDRILQELLSGRPVHAIETIFRRRDGTTFSAQFSAEVLEMDGIKCMLAISRDITDLKRAEKELRQSEEQHRSSIEHAPYGICRFVLGGKILMVNSAMVRLLGYQTVEEVMALDLGRDVCCSPEDRKRLVAMARGQAAPDWPLATTWMRKDGSRISVHLAGRTISDEQGRPREFEMFVEDVTQKEALENQLRIVQKMEAVGQLAGGVAHDFNNLLMIMGSRAEMILEHLTETQRVASQAEEIVRATRRGAALTGQLLAFSRKQVLQPTVVNLNEVLLAMNKILPRLLREDVETYVITSNEIGNVRLDRDQFEQVVINLAINARDAMPHGGQFRIETSPAEITEEFAAAHPGVKAGPFVRVTVEDNGVGMNVQTQSRIFEPFFTTKERGRGTGLGLAMVYGMVKQSGGFVEVRSAPQQGTTFSIYFPGISEAHSKLGKEETPQAPKGIETVLLVEDEAALRSVCAAFLRDLGYKVLEAANGAEALELYRRQVSEIDVLVTDVIMPRMTGLELYQHAKALRADLRAVFISGYSDAVIDYQALPGENAYLQKPFSMARLARQVRAALDRSN
jgi:two-component system, cell cycle sensor histidine kinase and response regulator CckA